MSSGLADLLQRSVAFLSEKVFVAMASIGRTARRPVLFCGPCAANVLAKVSPPSQKYYGWDWLAELQPRSPLLYRLSRLRRSAASIT